MCDGEVEDVLGKEDLFSEYMIGVSEGGENALPGLGQMTRFFGSYRTGGMDVSHIHDNVQIS